jgi:hypothetical protein
MLLISFNSLKSRTCWALIFNNSIVYFGCNFKYAKTSFLEKDNTMDELSQIALQWYLSENNDASAKVSCE